MRRLITLAAPLALLVLGGCSALRGPAASPPAEGTPPGAEGPGVRVEVDAPSDLRALLMRHLDLTRLGTLSRGDAVSDGEWSRLIDAAPVQVAELLRTEGYFSPEVQVARANQTAQGRPQELRLKVDPGPRTTVSRVTLEVEGPLQGAADAGDARARALLQELRGSWVMPPGAPFRNPAWNGAKAATLARLRASGYATASWNGTAAEVDPPQHQVRLFLVLDSGPLFSAGAIEVEGLSTHEAATVRNLANFKPGTPLTESLLLDYQERLQKSGLFESVTVSHDTDPAKAASSTVLVRLREQPLRMVTLGLGYSANTGPRTTVEFIDRRVFGWPVRARTYLEVANLKRALNIELSTHPQGGLFRNVAGLAIERLATDTDVVTSQRVRLGRARDTQQFEQLVFVEAERASRSTDTTRNDTIAVSGNAHAVLRRLDSVVLPTTGYTLALQAGLGHSHASSGVSGPFTRAYGRLTGYMPLGSSWFGEARVELGKVFSARDVSIPDSQLWRAGGDDSVRGYAYRDLGPVVDGAVTSGSVLFTGSIELARPFVDTMPSLLGAVFVDAGRAANSFGDLSPAIGAGVGLRWRSPVGPLKLDWAWARELRRARLHFSVGISL